MSKSDRSLPIVVSQVVEHDISTVWQAVTAPDQMRQWYFEDMPDFRPELDFATQFVMDSGMNKFTTTWRIVEVNPIKKVAYTWTYAEYPGEGLVTFALDPLHTNKTKVTVTNTGLHTFPTDLSEFSIESCRGGWEYFIKQRLPEYLGTKG
jgi:Uncharacterized conserved protein